LAALLVVSAAGGTALAVAYAEAGGMTTPASMDRHKDSATRRCLILDSMGSCTNESAMFWRCVAIATLLIQYLFLIRFVRWCALSTRALLFFQFLLGKIMLHVLI